jgi:hypothetical protein
MEDRWKLVYLLYGGSARVLLVKCTGGSHGDHYEKYYSSGMWRRRLFAA